MELSYLSAPRREASVWRFSTRSANREALVAADAHWFPRRHRGLSRKPSNPGRGRRLEARDEGIGSRRSGQEEESECVRRVGRIGPWDLSRISREVDISRKRRRVWGTPRPEVAELRPANTGAHHVWASPAATRRVVRDRVQGRRISIWANGRETDKREANGKSSEAEAVRGLRRA